MVSIYKVEKSSLGNGGKFLVELRGLSGDEKPTTINGGAILNGSVFIEIDTQDIYFFDEENTEWVHPSSEDSEETPEEPSDEVENVGEE